ncbi:MAG: sel1 repeat family protein [Firmicutes bacterium]|nr:sel1 repeat family protein [Bacillota bacterium]
MNNKSNIELIEQLIKNRESLISKRLFKQVKSINERIKALQKKDRELKQYSLNELITTHKSPLSVNFSKIKPFLDESLKSLINADKFIEGNRNNFVILNKELYNLEIGNYTNTSNDFFFQMPNKGIKNDFIFHFFAEKPDGGNLVFLEEALYQYLSDNNVYLPFQINGEFLFYRNSTLQDDYSMIKKGNYNEVLNSYINRINTKSFCVKILEDMFKVLVCGLAFEEARYMSEFIIMVRKIFLVTYERVKQNEKFGLVVNDNYKLKDDFENALSDVERLKQFIVQITGLENYKFPIKIAGENSKKDDIPIKRNSEDLVDLGLNHMKEEEYEKAYTCFLEASKMDDSYGYYNLGIMFEEGKYVEKDHSKAFDYYIKASERGNQVSMYKLGLRFFTGDFVEKDPFKAFDLFSSAASGYLPALYMMGECMFLGLGTSKNTKKGIELIEESIKLGFPNGCFFLGNSCLFGENIPLNYDKALLYFNLGLEKKDSNCAYQLGYMYMNGIGVDKNIPKAINYYETSANQGLILAMKVLAEYYLDNEYNQYDIDRAQNYIRMCITYGDEDAVDWLKSLT